MGGLGRKVFTRETLGSAEVNGYLMDQAVMRFASAAARAVAIPAPSEGMHTYLDDADATYAYINGAWQRLAVANGWATIANTANDYLWIPTAGWNDMPEMSSSVFVPAGRTLDVEWAAPVVEAAGGFLYTRILVDGVARATSVYSTGANIVMPGFMKGRYTGTGSSVNVSAQGNLQSGTGSIRGFGQGPVTLVYKIT